jgi:DNA-binding beta-propeller fold protein YncE
MAVCGALLVLSVGAAPALGAPADQVAPSAPENLRCVGRPAPESPGPGWQVLPVWEWREVLRVEGTIGSNDGPYAVALDRHCAVYVTDAQHFQVIKLSPDGSTQRWTLPGERAPGESSSPRGVAVDGQGNVYVTDTPRDRILKFSPRGEVVATWGECATPSEANLYCDTKQPGRFIGPEGIAVDGQGHVYVAEAAGLRIQRLSTNGQPEAVWNLDRLGALLIPGSLALDQGGFLYMSEGYNDQVAKFDPGSGAVVGRWGGQRSPEPGQFHLPLGVGVDAAGNLYVSDSGNWRVEKLAPDGAFLDQWRNCLDGDPPCAIPDAGEEPGQFFASRGITVDGQGTVYVADTANKRVQRLTIVDWVLIPPPDPDE